MFVRTRVGYGRKVAVMRSRILKSMINMLRALMKKVDNMQDQMNNASRERGILRKSIKETLEIKNTETTEKCLSQLHWSTGHS